jgi:hypothetical protein
MSQLIPPRELVSLLLAFAPCFTRPSFGYFVAFIVAMIAATERLTSTTVYRSTEGHKHYTNYARFLSRYRWSAHQLSQRLLNLLLGRLPLWRDDQGRRRLCLVIDETIVEKSSKRMYGVAWQRNTHGGWCRGTHLLGHYWLMLGVLIPCGGRTLCFPLGFRLYRQKKRCPAEEYRTPCQLVVELLESLQWPTAPDLVRTVIADAGFADKHLLRWCAAHDFVALVRGRMDAQVHDLYVRQPSPLRGRPRKYGDKISLVEYAQADHHFTHTVHLYQNRTEVRLASMVGLHRASGLPLQFVILRCAGKPDMVLMSSDLSLTPREIAQLYADRFAIEMTFRELKQHFGLGHYQVRRPQGILRHVHLSGLACALTQLLTLQPPREGFGPSRLRPIQLPWRKPETPVSVHETQRLLRHACLPPPTFAPVGSPGAHAHKSRAPASIRTTGAQEVLN